MPGTEMPCDMVFSTTSFQKMRLFTGSISASSVKTMHNIKLAASEIYRRSFYTKFHPLHSATFLCKYYIAQIQNEDSKEFAMLVRNEKCKKNSNYSFQHFCESCIFQSW